MDPILITVGKEAAIIAVHRFESRVIELSLPTEVKGQYPF